MVKRLLFFLLLLEAGNAISQTATDTTLHQRKIYVVSGMGWGFALGKTKEVLHAKFSSNLGLDISLDNRHYFIYPSLDFLTFGYNQQVHDPDYAYDLEEGRSNFYILNLAAGVRKQFEQLSVYAFAGPGAGVMVEPRAMVLPDQHKVTIENIVHVTPSMRSGMGVDYKLGGFFLFIEGGWLYNFRNIQDRPVNVISCYGGLKTDVTRLGNRVSQALGIE
ncbi:hypothetical protein [Parapedobacter tibetensis]|uniref:hypothetical protein n=1 Tax=Parapedobacter tibetensis TaxID=2972951 RepID=UPI00214D9DD0|nr:hypothetical protein [Parapedobacter tibetensis]